MPVGGCSTRSHSEDIRPSVGLAWVSITSFRALALALGATQSLPQRSQ